jgi:putative nucleotidyltransferase with HDIG domain
VLDAIAPSRRTARPSPRTIDTAELIVQLLETALVAPDVSSAVSPMLSALLARTAAVGSAYFQARGQSFIARAASGVMPQGPAMDAILLHGLPAETPLLHALGVQSLAAAPVHTRDGQFLGAFLMHTFVHHAWTRAEQQLFTAVSRMVAQLTARLVAEEQACQAQEDAIRALGLALEYRDDDTKGHTDRVTRLALRLGQALQLGDEELTALRWGAYLHDVGKMAIPDSILRKPARLDPDERTQMQQHAAIGATFAHQLSFMPPAAQALVRSHHERWDGTGYPDGLRGVEIPLTARIFALCDVYDALTSDRPYKRAWSPADALREIQNGAGSHFDPDLVARFVEIAAEIAEGG